jgi:oligopeptide transport system substrate-binding protein
VKLRGRGDVATASWIPPGLKSFYNESRGLEYKPNEARALLKAAGYENGKNFPEVEYLYPSREDAKALAEIMHSMWKKELNINVKLVALEWKVFSKLCSQTYSSIFLISLNLQGGHIT